MSLREQSEPVRKEMPMYNTRLFSGKDYIIFLLVLVACIEVHAPVAHGLHLVIAHDLWLVVPFTVMLGRKSQMLQ